MSQGIERTPSIFRVAKDFHELFRGMFKTQEDQPVSNTRLLLRGLGHIAVGTEFPADEPIPEVPYIPPVDGWRVTKSLAKAIWDKGHRQELAERFKEELVPPDYLGLMAVAVNYRHLRESGLDKEEARTDAWAHYINLANQE